MCELSVTSAAADQRACFVSASNRKWTEDYGRLLPTANISLHPSGKHSAESSLFTLQSEAAWQLHRRLRERSVPCQDLRTSNFCLFGVLSLILAPLVRMPENSMADVLQSCFSTALNFSAIICHPWAFVWHLAVPRPPTAPLAQLLPTVTALGSSHPAELQLIYFYRAK